MRERLPIVGVMGSGADAHRDLAEPLGRWLARRGVHLLTGGGGGVMESVSRAFHETADRAGLVVGILPSVGASGEPPAGYPNAWVEIPIRTHLPDSGSRGTGTLSRNHINVLSADVVIVLPGGAGTRSEVDLALRYARPVIAFGRTGEGPDDLPDGIPWAASLEEVGRFVHDAVAGVRKDPG